MNGKSILILGGYGNTGQPLAQYLLQETDAQVVIAGRSIEKAKAIGQHLGTKFEGQRENRDCIFKPILSNHGDLCAIWPG